MNAKTKSHDKSLGMEYALKSVGELTANPRNARTHSKSQIAKLAKSIKEFGFINPAIIDDQGVLVAGHGRLEAAKSLGMAEIPCLTASHLTEAQLRAYMLMDNRSAMDAGWDNDLLKIELNELAGMDFDLSLTGFDLTEISGHVRNGEVEGEDDAPEPEENPVSKLGDVWILGDHKVMCGDSTSIEAVEKLMNGQKADMVFTDPPYNVDYGVNNNPRHKIRSIKNDSMTDADWDVFVRAYISRILENCEGNIFISMSDKELGHMQNRFIELGGKWSSFIVWVKDRLVLSPKDFQSRHETILFGWPENSKNRHRHTDRTQTDVWEFPKPNNSDLHPTMKPVALVEHAIIHGSLIGSKVLDIFGGSGTTLIACEKTDRQCRMMELDEKYVDVIVKRWMQFTGRTAVLEATGEPFPELELKAIAEA